MFGDRFFGARFWGNRFFGPKATGNQTVFGVLYVNPDTFGTATIGRGAVNIAGVLYSNPDTFGGNTVSASYRVTGTRYSDPDTFGAATVSRGAVNVTGLLYVNPDTFGAASLTSSLVLNARIFIDLPDTFGSATVSTPITEYISPGQERCMRCGFVKGRSQMRKEWTGLLVCEDTCWEPRHPQMSLRGVPDRQNLPWTRPEPEPVFLNPNQVQASDL